MKNILPNLPIFVAASLLSAAAIGDIPAHAQAQEHAPEAANCTMTVLHPDLEGALLVDRSGAVSIAKGTLWVFSRHKSAVKVLHGAKVEVERVGIAGGAEVARTAKTASKENLKVAEANNALKDLPDVPAGDVPNEITEFKGGDEQTIGPGIYNSLLIAGSAKVKMAPGVYIIRHKLHMAGSGSLHGQGVTLINQGEFKIEASSQLHLVAPTGGDLKGIAFFQSRANTRPVQLGASAKMTVLGTVYVPTAPLVVANSAELTCTNLTANTVYVTNSGVVSLK